VPVDDRATPQAEEQDRREPERERGADRGAVVGQREDEPRLGHVLHPRARVRDEFAREEQPVVVRVERAEDAAPLAVSATLVLMAERLEASRAQNDVGIAPKARGSLLRVTGV